MNRNQKAENIALGMGVLKVDNAPIGLTRDGAQFTTEYTYRNIVADGDRGAVKGRIVKDEASAKLQINHLELLTEFDKLHTGIKVTSTEAKTTLESEFDIKATDYHEVVWVGETQDGRELTITLHNAINLENIDLSLKDKDEVIDSVTFTSTWLDDDTQNAKEPWAIEYEN